MALLNNAVLVPGKAQYFLGTTGTSAPADIKSIDAGKWDNIGHTSIEAILAASSEGGEATTLNTMQAKPLRTSYSARTESFSFSVHQFDTATMKLYFGDNMVSVSSGWLGVNTAPQVTKKAFLCVLLDGATAFGIYMPEAEIYRGEDFSFEDSEALAALPLKVTPVVADGNNWAYAMTPLGA